MDSDNKRAIPPKIENEKYYYDSFSNGEVLENKKTNRLPAMGWNSWNAFGSNNTEELTKKMADCIVELGLHKLGYKYIVLDDGCYCPERIDGQLKNEPVKFPNDFKVLADYIHSKGLKFGMYNDIGTNLCAGAAVGTCGHESIDAQSYVSWDVDFLKVDNCYYPWDNATFSDAANAQYVYTPMIKGVMLTNKEGYSKQYPVTLDNIVWKADGINPNNGNPEDEEGRYTKVEPEILSLANIEVDADGYVSGLGTFDGTGPDSTPVGPQSMEFHIEIEVPKDGEYELSLEYKEGMEINKGAFIQVQSNQNTKPVYDNFISDVPIKIVLNKGKNMIRLMNHRRQENTLLSYAKLLKELNNASKNHDIVLSICEWGKTQPQNWGYKVGASWRILNDITFMVGDDGNPGTAAWESDYTTSVTAQYNKAVIMDEFSGLDKGYNDPDMLVIGMNGLDLTMNRTHMTMWCMLNSPLMLGLDLRRIKSGDEIYKIIANKELISLNQDALGVQAKRIKVYQKDSVIDSAGKCAPDKVYIRDNDRVDILAKPLANGDIAVSFINLSQTKKHGEYSVSLKEILKALNICEYSYVNLKVTNLWEGKAYIDTSGVFTATDLEACDNLTIRISRV